MKTHTHYVGQGLKEKSFQEAVALGLNPNPNPKGSFHKDLGNRSRMRKWIKEDQENIIACWRAKGTLLTESTDRWLSLA